MEERITRDLKQVFGADDSLAVKALRLVSVYEDLRIEVPGSWSRGVPELDSKVVNPKIRELYFLRRSLITLAEFSSCLTTIQSDPQFKALKLPDGGAWKRWDEAVQFFQQPDVHGTLKNARNNAGGHFREETVAKVLQMLQHDQEEHLATIESFETDAEGNKFRVDFGGEVAVRVMLINLAGDSYDQKSSNLVVEVATNAYLHATRARNELIQNYVLPQFTTTTS